MKKLPNNNIHHSKSRKNKDKFRLIIFFLVFLLIISGTVLIYGMGSLFQKMQARSIEPINDHDISVVPQEDPKIQNKIINILILGLDAREKEYEKNEEGVRADSDLILTIDLVNNKIKLSSLMRDMYVRIDGTYNSNGYDKLTHAFAFGAYEGYERTGTSDGAYRAGALNSVRTVNQNFDMNVTDYAIFNFYSFKDIIDKMGGIDVNLSQDEIDILSTQGYDINIPESEQAKIPLKNAKPGINTLNGYQALNYARIRSVGDDIERTQRQRNVMQAMYNKLKRLNIFQLPAVLTSLVDCVNTSLDNGEIISISRAILTRNLPIESISFPILYDSTEINGVDYVTFDEDVNKKQMHDFIFKDLDPRINNNINQMLDQDSTDYDDENDQ